MGQKRYPYLRTENLKNHTLFRGTYLYCPYKGVLPGIPTRKADPNIFLIALKQDYIDAQYVKLPYSMWPFSIFYVLLHKQRQNVQKLNNFKRVDTLLDVMQIKFHDLLLDVTLICCAS